MRIPSFLEICKNGNERGGIMFEEYLEFYIASLSNNNLADSSKEEYKKEILRFFAFAKEKGLTGVEGVKTIHLDLYQQTLVKKGNAPTTRNRKMSVLRNFFSFLHSRQYIDHNPASSIERIKLKDADTKRKEILTLNESIKLIDKMTANSIPSLRERNRCLLYIFLFCGLRVSELVNLKTEDINFKEKTLYVRGGKGGKDREVPLFDGVMIEEMKNYIRNRPVESPFFFTKKTSNLPLSPRGVHDLIKTHVEKANIDKIIGCHSLRRTAASNLLESGVNLRHIQIYLGHSDISTTMRYLNPDKETIKRDIREKSLLGKKLKQRKRKKKQE